MRDARQGALNGGGVQDDRGFRHVKRKIEMRNPPSERLVSDFRLRTL
jgi:hypothetical protein